MFCDYGIPAKIDDSRDDELPKKCNKNNLLVNLSNPNTSGFHTQSRMKTAQNCTDSAMKCPISGIIGMMNSQIDSNLINKLAVLSIFKTSGFHTH